MTAELLLSHLERPRQTGRGTWVARCPAHEDRQPSMSIREVEDGRVLAHCFAGCTVEEIVGAVGLTLDALFPPKPVERAPALRRPFPAADVLESLWRETAVLLTCAHVLEAGIPLADDDRRRLSVAAGRIEAARRMANG